MVIDLVVGEPVEPAALLGRPLQRLTESGSELRVDVDRRLLRLRVPVRAGGRRRRGRASSAGLDARAVATAAETTSRSDSSVTDERPTTPAAVPSPAPTVAITVTLVPRIAPLVVRVLFAQRRLALEVSATMTTQPSAPSAAARARPRSIVSCGVS